MERRWMTVRLMALGAIIAAAMFVGVAPAAAADNSACLDACHAPMDFTVGAVDKATACPKCHTPGLVGTHPYHNAVSNCGASCHRSSGDVVWGSSMASAIPFYSTLYGSFSAPTSTDTTSSAIHLIHANTRWPSTVRNVAQSACPSCHQIAACDACHDDPIDPPSGNHSAHSSAGNGNYSAATPWSGTVARGIIGEDQTIVSAASETNQCSATACHNTDGLRTNAPVIKEDFAHPAYPAQSIDANTVVRTGTWTTRYGSAYTGGRSAVSNQVGATLTLTFTGTQVQLLADVDPYRGISQIYIDGVLKGTIDEYSTITKYQNVVWTSEVLTPAQHTIQVRSTGTKQSSARAAYTCVDGFRVYNVVTNSVAPECLSCHPDRSAIHGALATFDHNASQTAGVYPGPTDYTCDTCHNMVLGTEHARSSSKVKNNGCSACHTTYAPYSWTDTYDGTCAYSTCHTGARAPHSFTEANHTADSTPAEQKCRDCHGTALEVIHDESLASNGIPTDCLSCHSSTSFPTTKSCVSASCHALTGVTSMEVHPYTAGPHTALGTDSGVPNTGGKTCATCHNLQLNPEHTKSTSRTIADATINCSTCHDKSYMPRPWTDQCVECHTTGQAKMPHGSYWGRHDFTLYSSANATSCGGANCHNVAFADAIHDSANPGGGDCTSCHDTNTAVPTEHLCTDCHVNHNQATAHNASAYPANNDASNLCLTCHPTYSTISNHASSCANCHSNGTLVDYLKDNYTATCTDCHGGVLGGAYSPSDPTHFQVGLHTASPWTAAAQGTGADGAVPAGGEECSGCHTSTLKVAHATTSTSGGSVVCTECHTNTALGATTVIAGNWTNDLCTDCHDTGAATTHDGYTTAHTVTTTRGCAGSGASCHNFTNLASLHAVSQSGGTKKYSGCYNTDTGESCHASLDARPTAVAADSCGQGSTGCHQEKTVANHGAAHNYTSASDYSDGAGPGLETGCSNSGTGCHGTDATYGNAVTSYHTQGAIDCLASKCHASPTMTAGWKTTNTDATCSACHAGNFTNAVDAIGLNDIAPAGHYGETTHAATGLSATMKGSAAGVITAACTVCHNPVGAGADQLYNQHQGLDAPAGNTACNDCHGYNAGVTAEIAASWTTDTCADCHNATDMPTMPQHATGIAPVVNGTEAGGLGSCQTTGCHSTLNLHVLHEGDGTLPEPACTVCHDSAKQGATPTLVSCGTGGDCHTGTVHPGEAAAHTTLTSSACVACHESGDLKTVHGGACAMCHGNTTYPTLPTGKLECTSCHATGIVGTHAYIPTDPNHYTGSESTHTASSQTGTVSGFACSTCHSLQMKPEHITKTSSAFSTVPGTYADKCIACHEDKADALGTWDDTCDACHTTKHTASTTAHDFANYNAANTTACGGANCHEVSMADVIHSSSLPGAGDCTSCHDNNTAVPTEHLCTDCHAAHPNQTTVHTSAETACTVCHTTKTDITAHVSCATCHASAKLTDYLKNNYTATCTSCHVGGVLGRTFTPVDPAHATGSEPTHTATPFTAVYQGAGGDGSVPAGGEECSGCHSSTLKPAHATISTNGGNVTCTECHTDTTLGSAGQVAANWTNNKCKDCHDTGAATTHDAYATIHVVAPGSCADTGTSCHNFTNLAALHAVAQNGGTKKYNSCYNNDTGESCHATANVRPATLPANTCGQGSTGCHQEKTTLNHGSSHDLNAAGSDYNNTTVSGCTSAGAGCHGASAGSSYATYHPASGCTEPGGVCHEATNHNDALFDNPNSCQDCHGDGATDYQYAPLVSVLTTTPANGGHYNETTHTATGLTATTIGAAAGTVSATCSQCHNGTSAGIDNLYAQHQGLQTAGSTTCSDCHNYSAEVTAEIAAGWTTNTCADCHNATDMPTMPQHATGTAVAVTATTTNGCIANGCHVDNLHDLHKGKSGGLVASCAITGCHDFSKQGWKPTAKSCGAAGTCHTSGYHGNMTTKHTTVASSACVACHESTDVATVHSAGCTTCHGNATYPTLPIGKKECTSCHATGVVGTHAYTPTDPNHYAGSESTHTADGVEAGVSNTGGKTCATCHSLEMKPEHITKATSSFPTVPGTHADKCIACHELDVDALGTWNKDCQACHAVATIHPAAAFSTAHDFASYNVANTTACGGANCHNVALADVIHASTNPGNGDCTSCHDNNTALPTEHLCTDCHSSHAAEATVHSATVGDYPANSTCVSCHTTYVDLRVHTTGCTSCHGNPALNQYIKLYYLGECTMCHATGAGKLGTAYIPVDPAHYNATLHNSTVSADTTSTGGTLFPTKTCTACHDANLSVEHTSTVAVGNVTCIECHTNATLGSTTVITNNWPTDKCADCHTVKHNTASADHNMSATAGACATGGCHLATNIALMHADTTLTAQPTITSCNVCHISADSGRVNGVTAPLSTAVSCTSCHPTTPQHVVLHQADTSSACVACHETQDVQTIHSAKGDGCNVCHGGGGFTDVTPPGTDVNCVNCHAGESPTDPNHYTGTETTHTASAQVGTEGGFNCTQCHSTQMKAEHITKTTSAFSTVPGTYADKCIACHEVEVDTLGTWNDTCTACHATKHTAMGTSHDSSVVGAGCASTLSTQTAFFEGFETNNFTAGGWTNVGPLATSTTVKVGAYSAIDNGTGVRYIEKTFDLSGYTNPVIKFSYQSAALDAGPEYLQLKVNGVTKFNSGNTNQATWQSKVATLPATAGVVVRFEMNTDNANDVFYLDEIYVQHLTGTTCHDVADVSVLHNNSIATNSMTPDCTTCHTNATTVPTTITCADASCHPSWTHSTLHETTLSSDCTSCHVDTNVQPIHSAKGDGCNVCHGGGGYTDIQDGKTAECVSCHASESPANANHYAGAEATHTAGVNQSGATLPWAGNPTCGTCHEMVLKTEHEATTALKSTNGANICLNCHMSTAIPLAQTVTQRGGWSARNTTTACVACHDTTATTNMHGNAAITGNHGVTNDTQSCASSGPGCHPVANVSQVGAPTTSANIHTACASCHGTASRAGLTTPGSLAQGCTGNTSCHSTYTSVSHNALTGNDDPLHNATGNSAASIGGYTQSTACSNCHTLTMKTAHNTRAGWTGNFCGDCHNATAPINSGVVIKGTWNDTCEACHATKHDTYANHTATAGSGCTLSSGCHGWTAGNLDVRAVHDKVTSGCSANGTDSKGIAGACHAVEKNMTTTAMGCGTSATGQACHTSHTAANHGASHFYTSASNYADGSGEGLETGCSNSGTGCHGTDATYANAITSYHTQGAIDCLSSKCHTSSTMTAGWMSTNADATCSSCHAGNFVNAPDVTQLYDASPAGHYGDTTHTATGGLGTPVTAAGTASGTCGGCHDLTLKTAHSSAGFISDDGTALGTKVTCAECHNNYGAIVTGNWTGKACTACHLTATRPHIDGGPDAPVVNATSTASCGASGNGCHTTYDVHALHKNSALGCTLTGCHDTKNKDMTAAAKTCGQATGCHLSTQYTATQHNGASGAGLANGTDADHHVAGATLGSQTYTYNSKSAACSACHSLTVGTEHARATSTLSGAGADNCAKCHNDSATVYGIVKNSWVNKNTATACSDCHANTDATSAQSAHPNSANHAVGTSVTGCTGLGTGCHGAAATPDLTTVHATGCALTRACHSPTVFNPTAKTCNAAACHSTNYNTTADYTHRTAIATPITGNETTHTVAAGNLTTTLSAGGTANAACTACHTATLKTAHNYAAGFATASLSWTNECTGCHNATTPLTVATLVAANGTWGDSCTSNSCHSIAQKTHVDGGADPLVATGSSTAGCGASGDGCHNTYDLHSLHKNSSLGCTMTSCHDVANKDKTPTVKTCGQATGCHTSTTYTAANHNGLTGNDTTKHNAAGNSASSIGGYAWSTACTNCHTLTLTTGHNGKGLPWVTPYCGDCHNSTTPVDSVTVIKSTAWNNGVCTSCHATYHNTYASNHTATAGSGCTLTSGCHGWTSGGQTLDVRALHDNGTEGCGATGNDSKGTNLSCHVTKDANMTTTALGCGLNATGQACHTSFISGNHGGSNGGQDCLTAACHGSAAAMRLDKMVGDTTGFHHVLDNSGTAPAGGAGQAPAAANTYPTSTANLACVSCHTDHNNFNANKGANLRQSISNANASAFTNSDYIAGGTGICLSCHTSAQAKNTAGQKASTSDSANTPALSGTNFNASSHNYNYPVLFGTSTFNANCSKCHDDELDATQTYQTSTYKLATHFSAEDRLAKALGALLTGTGGTASEENLCYKCHTGDVAGNDGYGVAAMTAKSRGIQTEFSNTVSRHDVANTTWAGRHTNELDEYTNAPTSITGEGVAVAGWWGASNGSMHVECEDCHNSHEANSTAPYAWPANGAERGTSLPLISTLNKGVWGVNITGPTNSAASGDWAGSGTSGAPKYPTYTKTATASYEWQLCLKCHSRYAWGNNTPPNSFSGAHKATAAGGTTRATGTLTDVGRDFDPVNLAYHPLFAAGKNQPSASTPPSFADAISVWTVNEWDNTGNANRRKIGAATTGNYLSNTFTDGWLQTSRVTCSDCHGSDDWAAASGPHGSAQPWLLRGANTGIKVTIADGTAKSVNAAIAAGSWCLNCHRADVYGDGQGGSGDASSVMSRVDHPANFPSCDDPTAIMLNGCLNCHGGRPSSTGTGDPNGLIHGSSSAVGAEGGDALGLRFCNGASWDAHAHAFVSTDNKSGTVGNVGCSTIGASDTYSGCSQHGNGFKKTFKPNYYY